MKSSSSSQDYIRDVKDVRTLVNNTKLNQDSLMPITQAIYFTAVDVNIRLIELNSDLENQICETDILHFKGGASEKIVLCTEEKTYEVKEAEISNSFVLVENLNFSEASKNSIVATTKNKQNNKYVRDFDAMNIEHKYVVKVFHDYLECREIQPKFKKLIELLDLTRYCGPELEYSINKKFLFKTVQLLDTIQCSRKELENGLLLYRAIEVDGFIRTLSKEYEFRIVSSMLTLLIENSCQYDDVDLKTTVNSLNGIYPSPVVEQLFYLYTTQNELCKDKYTYREDMVCMIIAKNILHPGLKFHIDDFFTTWQNSLPPGMSVQERYLQYIGIIDRDASPPCVRALNEEMLPASIFERLQMLFKSKTQWTLDQITPYIECLATPQMTVTAVLAKYARTVMIHGQRIYVSKH